MSSETDRRAPDATRIPFDVMVEVGGAQGPSFEAQAMNVSVAGMALRAGYLPTVGQPLTCQFETEEGNAILASGEVTWCRDGSEGGAFGLSFAHLDMQSMGALKRLLTPTEAAEMPKIPAGRVRLHIDVLGVPMKARVRDASVAKVTTYSELGYLQAGKELELEDAETGQKRPARISRVNVETNEAHVPQLVVTMKYEDDAAAAAMQNGDTSEEPPGVDEESSRMKHEFADRAKGLSSSVGDGLKKLGPAIGSVFARAKTAAAMLAKKRKASAAAEAPEEAPVRRTTAPAPSGGLHASGRKVVRSSQPDEEEVAAVAPPKKLDKRKLAIGGAAGIALILGLMAMRKPHTPAPLASAPVDPPAAVAAAPLAPSASPAANLGGVPGQQLSGLPAQIGGMPGQMGNGGMPGSFAANQGTGAVSPSIPGSPNTFSAPMPGEDTESATPGGKKGKPKPFTNGPVAHGTVLKLKMDGPIERLQGAPQPTGFTVVLPNRRSLEAASPLASKDSRIAGIRVANDGNGAELSVTFKDGVPNYIVRAKGDTLEMVLAKDGKTADAKPAKKPDAKGGNKHHGAPGKGHGKH